MAQQDKRDRIRQVAIVLTSVDAATSRQILAQLPELQARQVRQRIANLGAVSPDERDAAMQSFMQMSRSQQATTALKAGARTEKKTSPAEALLSQVPETLDRFEVSPQVAAAANMPDERAAFSPSHGPSSPLHEFQPISTHSEQPFAINWSGAWHQWKGEQLARCLEGERPNVVAALILQCPTELGADILRALPPNASSLVLAALPQLQNSDSMVLQEIYEQLHTKLADFHRQSTPDNAGMVKLQSLLAAIPASERRSIDSHFAQVQPLLAHSLGISKQSAESSRATEISEMVAANSAKMPDELRLIAATTNQGIDEIEDGEEELEPESDALDQAGGDTPILDGVARELSFDNLVQLKSEDLAIVLRSLDPATILLATSAGGPLMQARVESMIDASEVRRLRHRLNTVRRSSKRVKVQAQEKMLMAANQLLRQGRIAKLATVAFVAA